MSEFTMSSPIGYLTVMAHGDAITSIAFGGTAETIPASALLREAKRQLEEYFAGRRRVFDLPLSPHGTEFQRRVWTALETIPYGETRTYAQIASAIGSPKACRAVGMANHCNPLPIVVPCHRVIGSGGQLTGYAGGLNIKQFLLTLEQTAKADD